MRAVFDVTADLFYPTLPLDEGERVIAIRNWDIAANEAETQSVHDFVTWRDALKSVEDIGAYRTRGRNLILPDAPAEHVATAEVSASMFRVARVPALLGRPILDEDERQAAPEVVVIGYDVWRNRFASDPAVLGRDIRLGNIVHRIIGVMPEGFAFPVDHRFWTPLKLLPSDDAPRQGLPITIFGRLAPAATLESAQAELTAIGRRTSDAFPETYAQFRPRISTYATLWADEEERWQVDLIRFLLTLVVVVVSVNVAALIYARTATRQGEIALRAAIGASRRRIVVQLFIEALVLSAGAAAVGLGIARLVLSQVDLVRPPKGSGQMPYWIDYSLSSTTILFVAGLAILGAVIAGVVPALQVTGRRLQSRLGQLRGNTGMHLGRTWTVLIVLQVAFAVALLPAPINIAWERDRLHTR